MRHVHQAVESLAAFVRDSFPKVVDPFLAQPNQSSELTRRVSREAERQQSTDPHRPTGCRKFQSDRLR